MTTSIFSHQDSSPIAFMGGSMETCQPWRANPLLEKSAGLPAWTIREKKVCGGRRSIANYGMD